jgi:hypothetical protein
MKNTKSMIVYHGSENIVRLPQYGRGNPRNDYGQGFYCTESSDLAKEWACTDARGGFANRYVLDLEGLQVLNLKDRSYTILHWLTVLVQHRVFTVRNQISAMGKQYLIEHFNVDTTPFDIIRGYRADDSYFSFAQDFLDNTITLRKLSEAMKLGKLGEQIVLMTPTAFSYIEFLGYEEVDREIYYPLKQSRDELTRSTYFSSRKELALNADDLFLADIIRGGITADDPRLQ